jgi:Holliday junction resolvase RusA-like endonuclease
MISITIPGKPIAKARPRFARRGKFVTTYSAQETEEGKFYMLAREQIKERLSGPITVLISLYFKRPRSHYGTGKNAGILKDSAPVWHIQKPDVDNAAKFILDVLNGLAWDDDKQIVGLNVFKVWGDCDQTIIMATKSTMCIGMGSGVMWHKEGQL